MSFGNWRWSKSGATRTGARDGRRNIFRDESDGYHATGEPRAQTLVPHGIQNLIHPRKWPAGSKLVTWVKLDERDAEESRRPGEGRRPLDARRDLGRLGPRCHATR